MKNYYKFYKFNDQYQTPFQYTHEKITQCAHEKCPECHGSGIKKDGSHCIHYISCPCEKCNNYF